MTEKEFASGLIGLIVGAVVASLFVGIIVDDSWRKYCVSKGAAAYVQCNKHKHIIWAWKEDR